MRFTSRCASSLALALALAGSLPAEAQVFKPKKPKVPDADVDQAIQKGLAWLKAVRTPDPYHDNCTEEIVLYTLFHGGCPKDDPVFQGYLQKVVDKEPSKTYDVALAAMCLSELDKAGYRWKLEKYAQFLVDNQCQNGQWSYGEPVPPPAASPPPPPAKKNVSTPLAAPPAVVASGTGAPSAAAPAPAAPPPPPPLYGTRPLPPDPWKGGKTGTTTLPPRKLVFQRRRSPESGDNSNSQYAALGLRACAEAGIVIDPKCLQDALNWWIKCQAGDGAWGYSDKYPAIRGSMTVGGVGSVAIYRWLMRQSWKDDPAVVKGFQWLTANWDLTKNPKSELQAGGWANAFTYYYIYGLERAGMIVGTDMIGPHDWYSEGAERLIKTQTPEGAWDQGKVWAPLEGHGKVWDTCFAILFLRRATNPLPPLAKIYTQ